MRTAIEVVKDSIGMIKLRDTIKSLMYVAYLNHCINPVRWLLLFPPYRLENWRDREIK